MNTRAVGGGEQIMKWSQPHDFFPYRRNNDGENGDFSDERRTAGQILRVQMAGFRIVWLLTPNGQCLHCACVHTQIWNGQAGWSVQQEACRWELHQWCEQGAGLHGCQGIFTLGHDLQAFRGEVTHWITWLVCWMPEMLGLVWLWFSLFCSNKRQEDQWDTRQGLPLCAAH